MTLSEFLLARIKEDEVVAKEATSYGHWDSHMKNVIIDGHDSGVWDVGGDDDARIIGPNMMIYDEGGHSLQDAQHIARYDPARVLAECRSKRKIVEACTGAGFRVQRQDVLCYLALPYVDHPDCLHEWWQ